MIQVQLFKHIPLSAWPLLEELVWLESAAVRLHQPPLSFHFSYPLFPSKPLLNQVVLVVVWDVQMGQLTLKLANLSLRNGIGFLIDLRTEAKLGCDMSSPES